MDEIMANIKSRRSRRFFIDKHIAEEAIEEILEAARYAPSALNKQPWKFIVISNKGTIRKLSDIIRGIAQKIAYYLPLFRLFRPELRDPRVVAALKKTFATDGDNVFYQAPLLILIIAEKDAGRYAARDCALAAENMMLYATSIGIGSCFIGRVDLLGKNTKGRDLLGVPPNHDIHAALVFGYVPKDSDLAIPQRIKDNVVKWVR